MGREALQRLDTRHWRPQARLRAWSVRFIAITPVHARVSCAGRVTAIFEADGERRARVALTARVDDGRETLVGEAVVTLP